MAAPQHRSVPTSIHLLGYFPQPSESRPPPQPIAPQDTGCPRSSTAGLNADSKLKSEFPAVSTRPTLAPQTNPNARGAPHTGRIKETQVPQLTLLRLLHSLITAAAVLTFQKLEIHLSFGGRFPMKHSPFQYYI